MSTARDKLNLLVCRSNAVCILLLLIALSSINVNSFSLQSVPSVTTTPPGLPSSSSATISRIRSFHKHTVLAATSVNDGEPSDFLSATVPATTRATTNNARKGIATLALISAVSLSSLDPSSSFLRPNDANAYDSSDYASDAVTTAVKSLKDSERDNAGTMKAFENIAEIITEGKGVGGSQSYSGVNLQRGFVADEDTAIYNPGLSILTESEKERLLDAVIQTRRTNRAAKKWTDDNQYAYNFLKVKLDPLHMTELRGYLGILPYYGAVLYVGSLAVQQFVRDSFPFVYIASAVAIILPVVALVLLGS